ncbi:MAG TPA: PP2C family serine/threonine-protein phosphatase [Malonomonas sp.]
MLLKSDSLSDIGRQRKRNEDCCYANPQTGLFIVADGMGGHPAGEVASKLAVETLREQLETAVALNHPEQLPERLEQALLQTSRTIIRAGQANPQWLRMGTTVAIAVIFEGQAYIANIGDSRIYLLRNGDLSQCSFDHNPTEPTLFRGRIQNLSSILTQALGIEQPLEPYQQQINLRAGDRLLLCTDGLNNMLSDADIRQLLQSTSPQQCCRRLVDQANNRGGLDNISVVVVDIA